MKIELQSQSIVNERTGVVEAPKEYVDNLRALERSIQRYDDDIAGLKADLKAAREAREKCVTKLRESVREGTVLPLLEAADEAPDGDSDDSEAA